MTKCKELDLLKSYLTDKLKAEKSIIKDAERFTFPGSDLIVDVFTQVLFVRKMNIKMWSFGKKFKHISTA